MSAAIIQLHVFIMYTFRGLNGYAPGSQLVTYLIDAISTLRVGREDLGDLYSCLYILGMPVNCHVSEFYNINLRERSGSVIECLTRDRRAAGSSLTGVTALWSLSKTHLS